MNVDAVVLTVHLVATLFMTGLVWFVQLVHYPLFLSVPREAFPAYAKEHAARTVWIVVPLMLAEAASAGALLFMTPEGGHRTASIAGASFLGVVWLSTAALQAPAHRRLSRGFDAREIRRLVAGNWIRTAAWTARVPVAVYLALAGALW